MMVSSRARRGLASVRFLFTHFLSLLAGGVAGGALVWSQAGPDASGGAAEPTEIVVYDREDFRRLLQGKTPAEVREAVGTPDRTSEDSDTAYWHYRRRTRDPIADRLDGDAQVVFREGRVVSVSY